MLFTTNSFCKSTSFSAPEVVGLKIISSPQTLVSTTPLYFPSKYIHVDIAIGSIVTIYCFYPLCTCVSAKNFNNSCCLVWKMISLFHYFTVRHDFRKAFQSTQMIIVMLLVHLNILSEGFQDIYVFQSTILGDFSFFSLSFSENQSFLVSHFRVLSLTL